MKEVIYSTKAKKDLKKHSKDSLKMEALYFVLDRLAKGNPLPIRCRAHTLIGQYSGCLECHIGNDFLLVWIDCDIIKVVRVGSHSELFK